MNDIYYLELLRQYKKSNGIKSDDIRYIDFEQWLSEYRLLTDDYAYFEETFGYKLGDKTLAEVGKGYMDTISSGSMIVISPYADTLLLNKARLVRKNDKLLVLLGNKLIEPNCIDTFITHNPYREALVDEWDRIHTDGFNVGVGIYGHLNDKDRKEKINMLSSFYEKLNFESVSSSIVNFEYDTDRDKFFGIVTAKMRQKIKQPKVKTK